jgi:2-octaprenyl-6-methoxyphenol hydroxylase
MTHVIIVGGGLTGGILACALAEQGLEVAVVDQQDPSVPLQSDGRSFALSRSSFNVLSKLGIWQDLGEVTPISSIHTSDGFLPRWVEYHEDDVGGGALGYVVDSALLKSKIMEKVKSFKNISLHAPTSITRFDRTETHAIIETDKGDVLKAPLCIAADGKFSTLREWAEIPLFQWSYDQVAIVCNMTHSLPHNNWAFEHFLPIGPLAFVPRPGNESGLVWSVEREKAEVYLSLNEAEFTAEVQSLFGDALGILTLSSKRWQYPLTACLPKRLIDQRLALVGDAAHAFHPVAGQGLNVGLRGVAVLAEELKQAFSLGLDLGSQTVLSRYQKRRRIDIATMAALTDGMVRVFSNQSRFMAYARSIGFGAVKHCKPLRHFMIRHAMGVAGKVPYLAKD